MRCPMFTESRYAYPKRKKQCIQVASEKAVSPDSTRTTPLLTGIAFVRVCTGHGDLLRRLKREAQSKLYPLTMGELLKK